jgi:hypothetical protein
MHMNTRTRPDTHTLGASTFLHLPRQPVLLQAEAGTLWVTEDGEPDDHQIDPGTQRRFDGHAALTVGTLGGAARVRVVPLAPTAPTAPHAPLWRLALPRWLQRRAAA